MAFSTLKVVGRRALAIRAKRPTVTRLLSKSREAYKASYTRVYQHWTTTDDHKVNNKRCHYTTFVSARCLMGTPNLLALSKSGMRLRRSLRRMHNEGCICLGGNSALVYDKYRTVHNSANHDESHNYVWW